MKVISKDAFLFFIIVFGFLLGSAQENNYWFANFGVVSTLKGGIEVGGSREVSSAYYNPSALAFIEGEYFEAQADLITMEKLDISNAGGDDINLNLFTLDVAPSIVGYMKRLKKNPRVAYAVGILTRYSSNLSFDLGHEETGSYLSPLDEEDVFQGQFRYDNRIRESWVFGSFAYRLSEKVALGLGTNLFIRAQDYFRSYSASAFPLADFGETNQFSNLTSNDEEQKFNYRVMGFIFKPSISLSFDQLKLGMTMSTPALNLRLLNNASYRSQTSIMPDTEDAYTSKNDAHVDYKGVYKTPVSVSIGAEQELGNFKIAIAGEWFASIDPYEMIIEGEGSTDLEFPTGDDPQYAKPLMAHKSVVNFGFSVQYQIKEGISYIGSFRTDYNFFDDGALDRQEDFVPYFTYWNLNHITSGIKLSSSRLKLTAGFDYGFGSSKNDPQFVSMTSARQDNFLRGDIENSTSTRYQSLGFTLGFNFNFEKSTE